MKYLGNRRHCFKTTVFLGCLIYYSTVCSCCSENGTRAKTRELVGRVVGEPGQRDPWWCLHTSRVDSTSKTMPEPLTPPEKPMAGVSRVAIYLLNSGLPPR